MADESDEKWWTDKEKYILGIAAGCQFIVFRYAGSYMYPVITRWFSVCTVTAASDPTTDPTAFISIKPVLLWRDVDPPSDTLAKV